MNTDQTDQNGSEEENYAFSLIRLIRLIRVRFGEEGIVKGPPARSRYDVRRAWECPQCQHKRWTGGQVVNLLCPKCRSAQPPKVVWMRLIEGEGKAYVAPFLQPPG